jgi:hypothetical protein
MSTAQVWGVLLLNWGTEYPTAAFVALVAFGTFSILAAVYCFEWLMSFAQTCPYHNQRVSASVPVAFAEAFPTNVRYSGSALAYTGANLIAGGPMPVLAVWLVSLANGSPWGVVALCVAWNLLSLAMILTAPETRGIDMNRVDSIRMLVGEAA